MDPKVYFEPSRGKHFMFQVKDWKDEHEERLKALKLKYCTWTTQYHGLPGLESLEVTGYFLRRIRTSVSTLTHMWHDAEFKLLPNARHQLVKEILQEPYPKRQEYGVPCWSRAYDDPDAFVKWQKKRWPNLVLSRAEGDLKEAKAEYQRAKEEVEISEKKVKSIRDCCSPS